ncbi:hypothetical protein EAH79_11905 [Sphingomonas koreensis]|nr:hypothetical protein EAH79_11905 [Sphingomonas koreensis]
MTSLDVGTVEKFLVAFGSLITLRKRAPSPKTQLTVMFSYGAPGLVDEQDLARTVEEQNIDVIHVEFEAGKEADGPTNIYLCEDRNGTILTWPRCDFWTDRGSFFLVVPKGQDFGFAFDGSALIRVTGLQTGPAFDENVKHASGLLTSAAGRVPAGITRVTQDNPAPYLSPGG